VSAGLYHGRLLTDGLGNLLADETTKVGEKTISVHDESGELVLDENGNALQVVVPIVKYGKNHGKPVAEHEGSYVFVQKGEPSHNERHHERFTDEISGTVDESMTDDETLVNVTKTENQHHFGVQEDDPNYNADAPNGLQVKLLPDSVSATQTGHTEAWRDE
jgi:hypothetical protein